MALDPSRRASQLLVWVAKVVTTLAGDAEAWGQEVGCAWDDEASGCPSWVEEPGMLASLWPHLVMD